MSTLFASLLIAHVVTGLAGVMLSFSVTLRLLKHELEKRPLVRASCLAFFAYMVSWLAGGWYYWKYYGTNVKPAIVNGSYKWAHLVFMEAKEHVFLFLPFATLALAIILHFMFDELTTDSGLKKRVTLLSVAITTLAVIITLSGILITGGARA